MTGQRLLGPLNLPTRDEDVLSYYNGILRMMYGILKELQDSFFIETHVAPAKPREGMVRFADGTDWNPGSGRGLYSYVSGSWAKL